MERQHNKSFLTFHTKQKNSPYTTNLVTQIMIASLLFIVLMMYVQAIISWNDMSFIIYMPGILLISLLMILSKQKQIIVISIYLLVAVIVLMIGQTLIRNGLYISINQLFTVIGNYTGTYIPPYEVNISESAYRLATTVVFAYLGLIIAYISYLIIKHHIVILLWMLLVTIFIIQSILELDGLLVVNIVSVFVGLLLSIISIYKKVNIIESSKKSVFSIVLIYLIVIFALVSISVYLVHPIKQHEASEMNATIQAETKQKIYDLRYEKNQTNTFTEGDFTKLGELILKEETALEVIMEKPTSVYLRGYVGSTYTNDQWLDLDPEIKYAYGHLFYWLEKESFHPLNQLSIVNELMNDKDLLNEIKVSIHNIQANSNYLYTPYELMTERSAFEDIHSSSHATIESKQFFGNRAYQFNMYENLVSHYPTLANHLYETNDDDKNKKYKTYEQHYNQYVYDVYTEIPEETAMMLDFYLEKEDTETHIAYETAISMVKEFLSRRLTYQLNPEPLPKNHDFLTHVLEDTKEGYATHYATAATIIFRYLDIPARYVEGYLITPKDIQGKEAFEKIKVEGSNAHAWTEIYIDQLGWIPIETTPPYEKMMEPIDTSNYPDGMENEKESQHIQENMKQSNGSKKVKEEEEKDVIDKKENEEEEHWSTYLIYIGLAIFLLLLFYLVYYFIRKRLNIHKMKQSFYSLDATTAVTTMFSYSLFLISYDGVTYQGGSLYNMKSDIREKYGEMYAEQFMKAITLNQAAIYSTHQMIEDDRSYMLEFITSTVENVVKSKSFFKRVKLKYWDCIY